MIRIAVVFRALSLFVLTTLSLTIGNAFPRSAAAGASFHPIGSGVHTLVTDVSADGHTVVGQTWTPMGLQAFVWRQEFGLNVLGDLPGGPLMSGAYAISPNGETVVGFGNSEAGAAPLIWDAAGGIRALLDEPTIVSPFPYDISANGRRVVGAGRPDGGFEQAILWHEGDAPRLLDDPTFFDRSFANAISDNGRYVVGQRRLRGDEESRATVWDLEAQSADWFWLPGGFSGEATAVDSDGSAVVGAASSISGREAFLWRSETGPIGLGDLAGGRFASQALGVSEDGIVVVGESIAAESVPFVDDGLRAFVWQAEMGMRPLDAILQSLAIDLEGWTLVSATAISADGQVIVGNAIDPQGVRQGFIAMPEPEIAIMLIAGVVLLGATRVTRDLEKSRLSPPRTATRNAVH